MKILTIATICFGVVGAGAGVYASSGCGMQVSEGGTIEYCGQSFTNSSCGPGGASVNWCDERGLQLGCPESPGEQGPYVNKCTCSYDPFCTHD